MFSAQREKKEEGTYTHRERSRLRENVDRGKEKRSSFFGLIGCFGHKLLEHGSYEL